MRSKKEIREIFDSVEDELFKTMANETIKLSDVQKTWQDKLMIVVLWLQCNYAVKLIGRMKNLIFEESK